MQIKKKITGLLLAAVMTGFGSAHTSFGQGTKLSSFPLATIIDSNVTLVGVWDSAGRKLDKRYNISAFGSLLAALLTLDQVLYIGNTTSYSARFTDYGMNVTDIDHGMIQIHGAGHHAELTPGTLYVYNSSGGFSVLSSGGNPSVGMSNVSGSHIGYIIAPTVSNERFYRMPDSSGTVALLNNLEGFLTIADSGTFATRERVQKAIDSLNAVIALTGGNLQATLTAGNMTDLTAVFGNATDTTRVTPSYVLTQATSNKIMFAAGNIGGTPAMILGSDGLNGEVTVKYEPTNAYNNYWIKNKSGMPDTFAMISDLVYMISILPGMHAAGSPTVTVGAGGGTSPGSVTVNANDLGGQVTFTTGTSPSATPGDVVFRVAFHTPFSSAPRSVILTPANHNTALLGSVSADVYIANITASYFEVVVSGAALSAATQYSWFFIVHQ